MARKALLKLKLPYVIPKLPKQSTDVMNYAWRLFDQSLDKNTVWYDPRDPEKEI